MYVFKPRLPLNMQYGYVMTFCKVCYYFIIIIIILLFALGSKNPEAKIKSWNG